MKTNMTAWRRDLHRIPEIGLVLPKTHTYILDHILPLRAQIESVAGHGVTAFFDLGHENTVAFRADMDALPISEMNDGPYRSSHPGSMHACGHDAHMAIMLGFAHWVDAHRDEFNINILLIFQPGEEQCLGAKTIVDSGTLERYNVRHIFALHVEPSLQVGQLGGRAGVFMAGAAEVALTARGISAHIARAEEARDALAVGIAFYQQTHELANRFHGDGSVLLKYGKLHAGTAHNIIAGHCELVGSLRTFSPQDYAQMRQGILRTAEKLGEDTGVHLSASVELRCPPLVNDPVLFARAKSALSQYDFIDSYEPVYLAEDFSWYLHDAPGCLLYLGTGVGCALHAANFDIDERALDVGLDALVCLAKSFI